MAGLSNLTARGLKSSDRSVHLDRLNLILGPVGAGKSSVLDALCFGALGCIPRIGRNDASTARIMRDAALDVAVELTDGRRFERTLERHGQKLSRSARVSWVQAEQNDSEAARDIRALFGASDELAAQHLDIRQLLACSANERAKAIEALLDAGGLDAATLVEWGRILATLRAAEISADRIPSDLAEAATAAAGAEALLARPLKAAIRGVRDEMAAELRSKGIALAAEAMRKAKTAEASKCREKVAARKELEERLIAMKAPADSLEDLRRRRDAARDAAARARRDLEAAETAARVRTEAESIVPALREQVTRLEGEFEIAFEALETAKAYRAEATELGADPAPPAAPAVVEPDPRSIEEADRADAQADEDEEAAARMEAALQEVPDIAVEQAAVGVAKGRLDRAGTDPWSAVIAVAKEIGKAAIDDEEDETPLASWAARLYAAAEKAGAESVEALAATLEEAHAALQSAAEIREALLKRRATAEKEIADTRAMAASYRKHARDARSDAQGRARVANAEARRAHEAAVASWKAQVDDLRRYREALIARAERLEINARRAQEELDRARADLTAAEARLAGQADVAVDATAARSLLADAEATLAEVDPKIRTVEGADACKREMAALVEEVERFTALQAAYAAAEWACHRLREEDLRARAGGLEERMRAFLRGAGRQEDPYLRASKGVCDFGLRRDGREISVEALSGGESVLFMAALAAAVIALRAPEVKVLLIEAAELGAGDTAAAVLRGCEAIADTLDTVVVATCANVEPREGWNVIQTGELAEAAR